MESSWKFPGQKIMNIYYIYRLKAWYDLKQYEGYDATRSSRNAYSKFNLLITDSQKAQQINQNVFSTCATAIIWMVSNIISTCLIFD